MTNANDEESNLSFGNQTGLANKKIMQFLT